MECGKEDVNLKFTQCRHVVFPHDPINFLCSKENFVIRIIKSLTYFSKVSLNKTFFLIQPLFFLFKTTDKMPLNLRSPLSGNPSGPVFCLLLWVSSDYAQPITGQVTDVTCPVIGRAQPELTPSKRQNTGPGVETDIPITENGPWCWDGYPKQTKSIPWLILTVYNYILQSSLRVSQQPVKFQWWRIIENANICICFWK